MGLLTLFKVALANFESVDQIVWCDHFKSRILHCSPCFSVFCKFFIFLFLSSFWIFALLEVYEICDSLLSFRNRPFPSPSGTLYQNEVKCSAFDIKMSFILMQIKLTFTRKVDHLASF